MRRLAAVLLALALVLILGDVASWLYATHRLRQYLDAWTAQRRAEGWTVASGPPARSGWPFAAALVLPDASIAAPLAALPARIGWRAAQVTLRVSLWNPYVLRIVPEGAQDVRLGDGPAIPYTSRALALSTPLDGSGSGDLKARDVSADLGGTQRASAGLLTAHVLAAPDGWKVLGSVQVIGLPAGTDWPLGPLISSVSLRATVAQDASIEHLTLIWGPLAASGHAAVSLDAARQPQGAGAVRLVGYGKALDAAVADKAIAPGAAMAMRAALGLLARASDAPSGNADADQVTVPVGLHDGTLTMAGIPVARLPELAWSNGARPQ